MTHELPSGKIVPLDWNEAKDEATGHMYYFNKRTGETSWTIPQGALPPGWIETIDPSTKKPYYYNEFGETSWTRPTQDISWTPKTLSMTEDEAVDTIIKLWRAKKARKRVRKLLARVYEEVYDPDTGRSFFYNKKPENHLESQDESDQWEELLENSEKTDKKGDWSEYVDETTMKSFYHNSTTNEFSWERPGAMDGKRKGTKKRIYPRSKMQIRIDEAVDKYKVGKEVLTLDISGFKAPKLSSRTWNVYSLQKLCIQNNDLTRIPSGIQDLEQLTYLDVSHNRLTKLPACMQTMEYLKTLIASHNEISSFTAKLWKISTIEYLDLSHNCLELLPMIEGDLDLLKDTGEWTISIGMLYALKRVELQHNKLSKWPEVCDSVEHFDISYNKIELLSAQIGKLVNLETLNIEGNNIQEVPESFCKCENLVKVLGAHNQISKLPEGIGNLEQLEELYLSQNRLNDLPISLRLLHKLRFLDISYNPMETIQPFLARLSFLQEWKLNNGSLQNLPHDIFAQEGSDGICTSLVALDISNNIIEQLPPVFDIIQDSILRIHAQNNCITDVPLKLFNCSAIHELNLSGNKITSLPDEGFANLSQLSELNLSGNQISVIPNALLELSNLTSLNFNENLLLELPLDFDRLLKLEVLHLSNCRLMNLPMSIGNLKSLIIIDVSGNCFEKKPPILHFIEQDCPNIRFLNLSNNPFSAKREDHRSIMDISRDNYNRGLAHANREKWLDAETCYTEVLNSVLKVDPYSIEAIMNIGNVFPELALECYFARGTARYRLIADVDQGVQELQEKILPIRQSITQKQVELSSRAQKMKRQRLKALKLPIDEGEICNNYEILKEESKDLQNKLNDLVQAVQEKEVIIQEAIRGSIEDLSVAANYKYELVSTLLLRGYAYMRAKKFGNAIDDFSSVIDLCPGRHQLFIKRAEAYARLGQMTLAIDDCNAALDLYPMHDDYTAQLEKYQYRWELYHIPAGVNNAPEQRAFFQDATGLYTKTDRDGLFKTECDKLRNAMETKSHAEKESIRKVREQCAALIASVTDSRLENQRRKEMDIQDQEQIQIEKEYAMWEEEERQLRKKEAYERQLMQYEDDYARWYASELAKLLVQQQLEEEEKLRQEEERRALNSRIARRGGRRRKV